MSNFTFDLIEESKKLIAIRSASSEGTREIVEYLIPFCKKIGFDVTLQSNEGEGNDREVNLIAHTVPTGSPDLCPDGLCWVTHLDTVPSGNPGLWTETGGNPFHAALKGDRIYGLGSADTKLDFLCKLQAIESIGIKNIKVPFALIGTFGEERALAGVRLLQSSGIVHPRWALVSEPSELKPVSAHKGILYMRAVWETPPPHPYPLPEGERVIRKEKFKGRAAHGSMPHLGENAIEKAFHFFLKKRRSRPNLQLLRIAGGEAHNIVPDRCEVVWSEGSSPCPRLLFLEKFFELMDAARSRLTTQRIEQFDPPFTTSNVGIVRGENLRVEIEFDFRLLPETDEKALLEMFQGISNKMPQARVEMIRSNQAMKTDERSELAEKVREGLIKCGLPCHFQVKSGNTEAAILNQMGAETIVIGPGRSAGNIHAPNEYNEISQLQKAVEFYMAFLKLFC